MVPIDTNSILLQSFVKLVPELFSLEGVNYFLSEKLNQDTLEEHFGKQRICVESMDNPSMQQYMYNERNIIAAQSETITSMHRNTHG